MKSTANMNKRRALGVKEPERAWWAKWRIWFGIIALILTLYCVVILLGK